MKAKYEITDTTQGRVSLTITIQGQEIQHTIPIGVLRAGERKPQEKLEKIVATVAQRHNRKGVPDGLPNSGQVTIPNSGGP